MHVGERTGPEDSARGESAPSPTTPPQPAPAARRGQRRRWPARLAAVLIAPLLALLLAEGAVRVAGGGYPTAFLVRAPDREAYIGNECFAWRFTARSGAPVPQPLLLSRSKPPSTLRIFVLGESAAMGVPEPAFGLARMLRAMLREQYPDRRFEVVNAAVMGINSHAILPIARELASFEPDAFVIYMGNNELCGFAGPMTVGRGQPLPAVEWVRFALWVKSMRLGQALHRAVTGDRRRDVQELSAFLERQIAADEPRRRAVRDRFARNLQDILAAIGRSGAPAVVCTVGVNLRECSPLGSLHRAGLSDAERRRFDDLCAEADAAEHRGDHAAAARLMQQALAIDDQHAAAHFRLARALLAAGREADARHHFVMARDLDTLPFRADSSINAAIREVAGSHGADGSVRLVDAEAAFAMAAREGGVPGSELFFEHVHMTFDGNHVLAGAVMPALTEALSRKAPLGPPAAPLPSRQRCAQLLALTPLGELRMAEPMRRLMGKPPFTNQYDNARMRRAWDRRVDDLARLVAATDDDALCLPFESALARDGEDWMLHQNYADALNFIGRRAAAIDHLRKTVELIPHASAPRLLLAHALLGDGRAEEAQTVLEELLRRRPDCAAAWKALGDVLAVRKRPADAMNAYERARRLNADMFDAAYGIASLLAAEGKLKEAEPALRSAAPDKPLRVHRALAGLYAAAGDMDGALNHYRQALGQAPQDAELRIEFAQMLARSGRVDEAIEALRQLIRDEPDNVAAHNNLAAALMGRGSVAEATEWYRKALNIRPDPVAHYNLGTVAFMNSRFDEAETHFRRAVELDRRMVSARHNLGSLLYSRGRNDEAINHLNVAVRLNPGHAAAHMTLAQALAKDRKSSLAVRHFRTAIELGLREAGVLSGLARILAGDPDDALRNGREAVALAEEACEKSGYRSPAHLDVLAAAYAEAGNFEKAAQIAQRAADIAGASGNRALAQEIRARAEAYRSGRPWRWQ